MRSMRPRALLTPLLLLAAGCGVVLEEPPIEIKFRESLIGAGKIVQVSNTSNTVLEKIEVTIRAPGGEERSFLREKLDAYETLEVGWKKLGGWQVPPGAEVTVRCGGFLRRKSGVLPGEGAEAG